MPATRISVSVEFERLAVASRWVDARWQPSRVSYVDRDPADADESAAERIDAAGALERWRFPGQTIEMHPSEAEGYYLNLNSPDPRSFVMWRRRDDPDAEPAVYPVVVTLSYNQAARMMDGGEQVDSVPLDPDLRAMLEPYVAVHYKPEPRRKHKRNDPFADGAFVRDRHGDGKARG
ncbi:hypothetical protein BURK1_02949 [Burkholderiales bacterium]|nr:hypothetical protein BURK1_02949 [Burkholderiales bacterium]